MAARKPFQFSLATLMVAVTGYAVFFGILRSLWVSNPAFIMITLYFTTVVYSQWALFGGYHPYGASFVIGGSLFALAMIADGEFFLPLLGEAFILGGLAGISAAGFTDIWLLVSQIVRGIVPKAWSPEWLPPDSPPDANSHSPCLLSRLLRPGVIFVLVIVFFLGMLWGSTTGQGWFASTYRMPGRKWNILIGPAPQRQEDPSKKGQPQPPAGNQPCG